MNTILKKVLIDLLDFSHKGAIGMELMHFNIEIVTPLNFKGNNVE